LPEAKRNLVFIRSKRELVARDFQYAGRELGALGVWFASAFNRR